MDELDALYAFLAAMVGAAVLTPLAARLAHAWGAVDQPRERGLSERATPRLGGLAILGGVLLAAALFLDWDSEVRGIMGGAALIAIVGAVDDVVDLHPGFKLAGQFAAGLVAVTSGVTVDNITLPFIGAVDFGDAGGPLTLVGLVAIMNVVNLSDGVDGLAAGVCTISAVAFSIIAFDLGRTDAGVLAALVAGASLGFLFHNFHPASIFMGDCGSNLLGFLLGAVAVQGALKTQALIALIGPLIILAVPFLDTSFVVAKRIKYGKPIYSGDSWHFHHRFANIGFSQRRTVLYLYAWSLVLAGLALAIRFVPYSDSSGNLDTGWALVMAGFALVAIAASVYLVLVLEILKFRRVRERQLRATEPGTSEHEIEARIAHELETGEFEALRPG